MKNYNKYLLTENYEKTYKKYEDERWDLEQDGKKIIKKAMADIKKSLGLKAGKIYDGGLRYKFVEYDTFTLGWKEFTEGDMKFSIVIMTTEGDGEIFVKDSTAMITAIKSMG